MRETKSHSLNLHSQRWPFLYFISAAIRCFERQKGSLIDAELKDDISVSPQDVVLALKGVKPSAMREVEIRVPKVNIIVICKKNLVVLHFCRTGDRCFFC